MHRRYLLTCKLINLTIRPGLTLFRIVLIQMHHLDLHTGERHLKHPLHLYCIPHQAEQVPP